MHSDCDCELSGSESSVCNMELGQCACLPNVIGRSCDRCTLGYFGFGQESGCLPCNCNTIGSVSSQCDDNRQCTCLPGVTGDNCDQCLQGYFNFTTVGCQGLFLPYVYECECGFAITIIMLWCESLPVSNLIEWLWILCLCLQNVPALNSTPSQYFVKQMVSVYACLDLLALIVEIVLRIIFKPVKDAEVHTYHKLGFECDFLSIAFRIIRKTQRVSMHAHFPLFFACNLQINAIRLIQCHSKPDGAY